MKSKKIVIASLALLVMLGTGISVKAEEDQATASAEVKTNVDVRINPNIKDMRVDFREGQKERRESFKASTTENRKDFLENQKKDRKDFKASTTQMRKDDRREKSEEKISKHTDRMVRMFTAAVERLEKIAERIDSRIAKLKTEGKNTTEAEANVASAKANIVTVKADIALIPGLMTNALEKTELNKSSFEEMKVLVNKIREGLKSSHASLVKAITSIKGLRVGASSTTTIQVEAVQ